MRIFGLHRKQRAAADYSGSLLYAGRWHSAGTPLLYASASLSLACLEMLVHFMPNQIPLDYAYCTADVIPAPEVADFRGDPKDQARARQFGQSWVNRRRDLAIQVPSVIIPIEFNVLLNPTHAEFSRVKWSDPENFAFDERLIRAGGSLP